MESIHITQPWAANPCSQQLLSKQQMKLGPEPYSKIGKGLERSPSLLLILKQDQPLRV